MLHFHILYDIIIPFNKLKHTIPAQKEERIMKQKTRFLYHIFALFIAFSFLPLFFSDNYTRGSDADPISSLNTDFSFSRFDISTLPVVVYSEELTPSNTTRTSCYRGYRNLLDPKKIYYSNGCLHFLISAFIIFIIIRLFSNSITYSRKFIIKYIHDQDGHKA